MKTIDNRIQALKEITLASPWSDDFGKTAWMHPQHDNEALAYWKALDAWVILDCCGDQSTFSTLSEALDEFLSPLGEMMWKEIKSQHMANFYFAASV